MSHKFNNVTIKKTLTIQIVICSKLIKSKSHIKEKS